MKRSQKITDLYWFYLSGALLACVLAGFAAGSLATNIARDQADQVYYQRIYGGGYGS